MIELFCTFIEVKMRGTDAHNFSTLLCPTILQSVSIHVRGRRYRDRMVVGFSTTYAISAYHH